MAHRAIWVAGPFRMREAVKKYELVKRSAGANPEMLDKCDTASEFVFAVAAREYTTEDVTNNKDNVFDGWLAYPPSEIVEMRAGAALSANSEVAVDGSGHVVEVPTGAAFVIGFVRKAYNDGDIAEVHIQPRYEAS